MTKTAIEKDVVLKRVNGIEGEIAELEKIALTPFEEFKDGAGFKLAQYHLHRALEGVFNISAHILSRMPGHEATEYKELARKLGEAGIVGGEFAKTKLVQMAKYRNRLVHFYAEITPDELYVIVQNDLGDFDIFLSGVKNLLEHPEKFSLVVE